jgi:hypothetical protein
MVGHPARSLSVRCAVSRSGRATCENLRHVSPTAIPTATSVAARVPPQRSARRGHQVHPPGKNASDEASIEAIGRCDRLAMALLSAALRAGLPLRSPRHRRCNPGRRLHDRVLSLRGTDMMRWGCIRPGAHLAGEVSLQFYDDELAIKFESRLGDAGDRWLRLQYTTAGRRPGRRRLPRQAEADALRHVQSDR